MHIETSRIFPVIILDRVLSKKAFASLQSRLHNTSIFFDGEGVTFPGRIALLSATTVSPLVTALRGSAEVAKLYPGGVFDSRFMRGFASLMCETGGPHTDLTFPSNTVPPAAVFYIDILGNEEGHTGTSFFVRDETQHNRLIERKRIVAKENRMILYPQDVLHNAWVSDEYKSLLSDCMSADTPKRVAISLFFTTQGGVKILENDEDEDEVSRVRSLYSRRSVHWPNWPLEEL